MNFTQVKQVVLFELDTQLELSHTSEALNIPCIMGPPGIGKTALVREVVKELSPRYEESFGSPLELVEVNVGESADPTDLLGLPTPDGDTTSWSLNKAMHRACEGPVCLFFDDIDKANEQVMAGLLAALGKRQIRDKKLHAATLLICAGNHVGEDLFANELSESIRTRLTVIDLEADLRQFCEYGQASGEIHPAVIGFLNYRPELLNKVDPNENRNPVPRTWREASQQMQRISDDALLGGKNAWHGIVQRKCGNAAGTDFFAWYSIVRKVDAPHILKTGDLSAAPADGNKRREWEYAAVFALASELRNNGFLPAYAGGAEKVFEFLAPELCLALAVQLSPAERSQIAKVSPKAAQLMARAFYDPSQKAAA